MSARPVPGFLDHLRIDRAFEGAIASTIRLSASAEEAATTASHTGFSRPLSNWTTSPLYDCHDPAARSSLALSRPVPPLVPSPLSFRAGLGRFERIVWSEVRSRVWHRGVLWEVREVVQEKVRDRNCVATSYRRGVGDEEVEVGV